MIKTEEVFIGMRLKCPDGPGAVSKILNPDTVMILLDQIGFNGKPLFAKFDLSECVSLEMFKKPVEPEPNEAPLPNEEKHEITEKAVA